MSLEVLSLCGDNRLFTLDLEWIGDIKILRTVRIFSIALVHIATGDEWSCIVDPGVTHEQLRGFDTFPGCRTVTRSFLRRNRAVPFKTAFARAVAFTQERCTTPWGAAGGMSSASPIVIAHGAFRGDMPALESALRRTSVPLPMWRFMDSLYYFRKVLPESNGYRLGDVAKAVGVSPESAGRAHDALPDARLLYTVLKTGAWSHFYGAVYCFGQTPLLNVPGIGIRGQNLCFAYGIKSVEDLLNFSLNCRLAAVPPAAPSHSAARTVPDLRSVKDAQRAQIETSLRQMGIGQTPAASVAEFCMGCLKAFDEKN